MLILGGFKMERVYHPKEVVEAYKKCYHTSENKFRYKDEEDLHEILINVLDLEETDEIEVDYETYYVTVRR